MLPTGERMFGLLSGAIEVGHNLYHLSLHLKVSQLFYVLTRLHNNNYVLYTCKHYAGVDEP